MLNPSDFSVARAPKLSVAMITYNHEPFIAQAIESVLRQDIPFSYEFLIADDCSTDSTPSIVADFYQRYPDHIVPILRRKNLGPVPNFVATVSACRGQYVALLEGDDYWTFDGKLRSQVNFLDSNPDFSVSCHRAQVCDEVGTWNNINTYPPDPPGTYVLEDLLAPHNFVMTCSTVYRRAAVPAFPAWFNKLKLGDWPLIALAARNGKIQLMEDVWAAYRVHSGGVWSSTALIKRLTETIRMLDLLDGELNHRYTKKICETITYFALEWALAAQAERRRRQTALALATYFSHGGWPARSQRRLIARLAAYSLFGSSYKILRKGPL